eukprot:gene5291-7353_t
MWGFTTTKIILMLCALFNDIIGWRIVDHKAYIADFFQKSIQKSVPQQSRENISKIYMKNKNGDILTYENAVFQSLENNSVKINRMQEDETLLLMESLDMSDILSEEDLKASYTNLRTISHLFPNITQSNFMSIAKNHPVLFTIDPEKLKYSLSIINHSYPYLNPSYLLKQKTAEPSLLITSDLSKKIELLKETFPNWNYKNIIRYYPIILTKGLGTILEKYKGLHDIFQIKNETLDIIINKNPCILQFQPIFIKTKIEKLKLHGLQSLNVEKALIKCPYLILFGSESELISKLQRTQQLFLKSKALGGIDEDDIYDAANNPTNRSSRAGAENQTSLQMLFTQEEISSFSTNVMDFQTNDAIDFNEYKVSSLNNLNYDNYIDNNYDKHGFTEYDNIYNIDDTLLDFNENKDYNYNHDSCSQPQVISLPSHLQYLLDPVNDDNTINNNTSNNNNANVNYNNNYKNNSNKSNNNNNNNKIEDNDMSYESLDSVASYEHEEIDITRIVFGNADIFNEKFPYFKKRLMIWIEAFDPLLSYTLLSALPSLLTRNPATVRPIIKTIYGFISLTINNNPDYFMNNNNNNNNNNNKNSIINNDNNKSNVNNNNANNNNVIYNDDIHNNNNVSNNNNNNPIFIPFNSFNKPSETMKQLYQLLYKIPTIMRMSCIEIEEQINILRNGLQLPSVLIKSE